VLMVQAVTGVAPVLQCVGRRRRRAQISGHREHLWLGWAWRSRFVGVLLLMRLADTSRPQRSRPTERIQQKDLVHGIEVAIPEDLLQLPAFQRQQLLQILHAVG